ncbi:MULTISPECIES: Rrf2 family transcriptional regulator [Sulfurospirillum]|jgi:Rrf2 family protein|uniref:Transcriptional regulator n=1 Tax=Sulfurospirillum cavolei TaxID=366522 RepID=A0A2D3W5Y8_9BACT|nr:MULTISPECIES: Rrf2 family transcriptional regulator [Sulfurospirillum]KHG34271.1 MAG: Rrf2 family transcriptional regulator [Sulfurospirillum sp. MES]MCD8544934.1 Rrf2 family transcriptional regulator [Sulfurospirillum cavolei]MCP3651009.1 Rrf2 family transcriptional regulator [Sulfurospirillum sp. DNRA8]MCR1809855.1 Rrf2 family transcriptional regulator [Sulfurospirillum sp. DNRA8]MDY0265809.1 Rrf2 family transcriptional regulator [Sulfurospirillum cavolei]
MLLTKASEYALLSLIIIAQKNSPQDVDTLSNQLGISKSFLAKILQSLAKENILSSFKGAHGGFMLAKKPDELTLKAIVECAEKKQTVVFECSPSSQKCPGGKGDFCRVWPILNRLQSKIDHFLDNMTLKDIIEI